MTTEEIQAVQDSFAAIGHDADALAAEFYARLFDIAPEVRPLFAGVEMRSQGAKLMSMLQTAVKALAMPSALMPVLDALGRRHAGYGVEARHYDAVGQALLETLQGRLGAAFTPEVAQAWAGVYGVVASRMQAAAAERAAA